MFARKIILWSRSQEDIFRHVHIQKIITAAAERILQGNKVIISYKIDIITLLSRIEECKHLKHVYNIPFRILYVKYVLRMRR